jgi:hypothetical protein
MSAEERAARLAAMSADAESYDVAARQRAEAAVKERQAEEAAEAARRLAAQADPEPVQFLHQLNQKVYSGTHETLAERLNKNKHYRQKGNIDEQKFL